MWSEFNELAGRLSGNIIMRISHRPVKEEKGLIWYGRQTLKRKSVQWDVKKIAAEKSPRCFIPWLPL